MTLNIALVGPRETVLVADRRLVDGVSGSVVREEAGKLAVLFCSDARAAVTYTGLAAAENFSTHRWLIQSLLEAARPDFQLRPMLERLAKIATRDVARLALREDFARLSVVVCGYHYGEPPPLSFLCRVTNFEHDDGTEAAARDIFSVTCLRQRRNAEGVPARVLVSGAKRAVSGDDRRALERLLREEKPSVALVEKAVAVIRSAARSRDSRGLIGEQCLSVVIPRNRSETIVAGYHSAKVAYEMFMPDIVDSRGPRTLRSVMDVLLRALPEQSNVPPLVVPKVRASQPCPCGSGKKYKNCHGVAGRTTHRNRGA
jgi:SEC-C motif